MLQSGTLAYVSCASAALAASLGAGSILACRQEARRRRNAKMSVSPGELAAYGLMSTGAAQVVLGAAVRESSLPAKPTRTWWRAAMGFGTRRYRERAHLAGIEARVTVEGLCRTRVLACAIASAVLMVVGYAGSVQLAAMGFVAGLVVGWLAVPWALDQEAALRKRALEHHLSEAIEVICLGLRSGLSFDYALHLYCDCFDSALSRELALALREWQAGLRSREEVLRDVASTYDSAIFSRVVDNVVRAMRFGSPLAESLEVLATEARQGHKAYVQERVMKAPVKMMLPVGTLILPSMLILVLGPVLLDLMQGF